MLRLVTSKLQCLALHLLRQRGVAGLDSDTRIHLCNVVRVRSIIYWGIDVPMRAMPWQKSIHSEPLAVTLLDELNTGCVISKELLRRRADGTLRV